MTATVSELRQKFSKNPDMAVFIGIDEKDTAGRTDGALAIDVIFPQGNPENAMNWPTIVEDKALQEIFRNMSKGQTFKILRHKREYDSEIKIIAIDGQDRLPVIKMERLKDEGITFSLIP